MVMLGSLVEMKETTRALFQHVREDDLTFGHRRDRHELPSSMSCNAHCRTRPAELVLGSVRSTLVGRRIVLRGIEYEHFYFQTKGKNRSLDLDKAQKLEMDRRQKERRDRTKVSDLLLFNR